MLLEWYDVPVGYLVTEWIFTVLVGILICWRFTKCLQDQAFHGTMHTRDGLSAQSSIYGTYKAPYMEASNLCC
jgi:hypothetical protein